ncbi:MAG TPA: hypothetical protein VFQ61_30985 [Polyangiaceae bacterium]|nr:hypothetical protein [Polyangiaceae bacterium]
MKLVEDPAGLAAACQALESAPVLYLDTEFDASRDGTRLCLVQISGGAEAYLVDTLKLSELGPLSALLGHPDRTWVLHAGQQDIQLLKLRLHAAPTRLFDTQVAWALSSIEHSASLSYLKYHLLGLRGEKSHQADDWLRRPLPPAQLAYAAEDVHHLPALFAALTQKLDRLSRTEACYAASRESVTPVEDVFEPLTLEAFRNAWQLEPEGQAVLRYLVTWFNELSPDQRSSAPDFKGLFSLASRRPRTLDDLSRLRTLPRRASALFGRELVSGIARAIAGAHTTSFQLLDPPPYAVPADLLAAGWLEAIRAELCIELTLAPELVLPARILRRLREAAVRQGQLEGSLAELQGWRADLLHAPLSAKMARYGSLKNLPSRLD